MRVTVTLTEKDFAALNYLAGFEDELENLQTGFQSVADAAAEKAAALHGSIWQAAQAQS